MRKYKATWKLYSARRKITLESLIKQQKISGYESYVTYCENMSIEPISLQDFKSQTTQLFNKVNNTVIEENIPESLVTSSTQQTTHTASETSDLSKNKKKLQKLEKSTTSENAVAHTAAVENNKEN